MASLNGNCFKTILSILSISFLCLLDGCVVPSYTSTVERFQNGISYSPIPSANRIPANVLLTVICSIPQQDEDMFLNREAVDAAGFTDFKQAFKNVNFDDISKSGIFKRVDAENNRDDIDLLITLNILGSSPENYTAVVTVRDPFTKEMIKEYRREVCSPISDTRYPRMYPKVMADLRKYLYADFRDRDFLRIRQMGQEAQRKAREEEETKRRLAEEARQGQISRETDQDNSCKLLFNIQPDDQFTVSQVTEFLITWKNRHLDNVLRSSTTEELREYMNQIEHTIFQAMDASEKEKDEAQRLIAGGVNAEHEHTDLARAYRLRIEVLKPILAALKEESANRTK